MGHERGCAPGTAKNDKVSVVWGIYVIEFPSRQQSLSVFCVYVKQNRVLVVNIKVGRYPRDTKTDKFSQAALLNTLGSL